MASCCSCSGSPAQAAIPADRCAHPGLAIFRGGNHPDRGGSSIDYLSGASCRERLAEATAAAARLTAAVQCVSRRTLRAGGLHGSNAHLGAQARTIAPPATTTAQR